MTKGYGVACRATLLVGVVAFFDVEPSTFNFDSGHIVGKQLGAKLNGNHGTFNKLETWK